MDEKIQSIKITPDYAHILNIAKKLYRPGKSGAALFVGAGLSRNAARHISGAQKLPLWSDLVSNLKSELQQVSDTQKSASSHDPLQVAEEYRAYFGQSILDDKLREFIDDDSWVPGDLFREILELPWCDVLTTNWDTLLERAAKQSTRDYAVVNKVRDFTWVSPPRIAKLHGTIGVSDKLIFAEEDYRKYSNELAPFVNFARQVFIENELVLIGFSGSDPNFKKWSGWVRDNFSESARTIYLVGVLDLTASSRRYLESKNITPIDLGPMVSQELSGDDRHESALCAFVEELHQLAPDTVEKDIWPIDSHPSLLDSIFNKSRAKNTGDDFTEDLEKLISLLKSERTSYPGFLVPDLDTMEILNRQISNLQTIPFEKIINRDVKLDLIFELTWRVNVSNSILSTNLKDIIEECLLDSECKLPPIYRAEFSLAVSHFYRVFEFLGVKVSEERKRLMTLIDKVLEKEKLSNDSRSTLFIHKYLYLLDNLEIQEAWGVLNLIQPDDEYIKFQKSLFMLDFGKFLDAKAMAKDAMDSIRNSAQNNPKSLHTMTRYDFSDNYYQWIFSEHRFDNRRRTKSREASYLNPNMLIKELSTKIWKINGSSPRSVIKPVFKKGQYKRVHSWGDSSGINLMESVSQMLWLQSKLGIRPLLKGLNINFTTLKDEFNHLLKFLPFPCGFPLLNHLIRFEQKEEGMGLTRFYSRVAVAAYTADEVAAQIEALLRYEADLFEIIKKGIETERNFAISELKIVLEILGRLTLRMQREQIIKRFIALKNCFSSVELQIRDLEGPLETNISSIIDALDSVFESSFIEAYIGFPLLIEISPGRVNNWIDFEILADEFLAPNDSDLVDILEPRIGEVIRYLEIGDVTSQQRTDILSRLLPLIKSGLVSQVNLKRIEVALWTGLQEHELPKTLFYPHVFLDLPHPDGAGLKKKLRKQFIANLVETDELKLDDTGYLKLVGLVSYGGEFTLSRKEASEFLSKLAKIDFPDTRNSSDRLVGDFNERTISIITLVVQKVILPSIVDNLDLGSIEQILLVYNKCGRSERFLPILGIIAVYNNDVETEFFVDVEHAFLKSELKEVQYVADALVEYAKVLNAAGHSQLTAKARDLVNKFVYRLEVAELSGLHHILWSLRQLSELNLLPEQVQEQIIKCLVRMNNSLKYIDVVEKSEEEILSFPLVREEMAKFVCSLKLRKSSVSEELEEVMESLSADPLPEVRNSIKETTCKN